MKIEKINDNQIRCTLTPDDLKSRDIRISELTYGSGKARNLFREMMKEALQDCGFRLDNTPLMIEASPDADGNLTLIITKVRNPEEIDSRFAHFTSDPSGDDYTFSNLAKDMPAADDILKNLTGLLADSEEEDEHRDLGGQAGVGAPGKAPVPVIRGTAIVRRKNGGPKGRGTGPAQGTAQGSGTGAGNSGSAGSEAPLGTMTEEELFGYTRFYMFHALEDVIRASRNIGADYAGGNTLYKNPDDGEYYLLIRKERTEPERFNQICNVLSEYGLPMDFTNGTDEFFREHMKIIVSGRAVQQLRTL